MFHLNFKIKFRIVLFSIILLISILYFTLGISINGATHQELRDVERNQLNYENGIYGIKAPNLVVSRIYEINDDVTGSSDGNADGRVDAGETIELRLELENTGDEDVTNVYGNLSTTNSFVTLSSFNQSYLHINAGATSVSSSYYLIEFDSRFNLSDTISFILNITAEEGSWIDNFDITINGIVNPEYYGFVVFSESDFGLTADDDGIIDPGEDIRFTIYVINNGNGSLIDSWGYISATDTYVTITDNTGQIGSIYGEGDYDYAYFELTVSGSCPLLHTVTIQLSIVDGFGKYWNSSFDLVVSGLPEYEAIDFAFAEYNGNEDTNADAGETWMGEVTVKNIGDAVGKNVEAVLNSDDENIEFYYVTDREINLGDIEVGFTEEATNTYYWRFLITGRVLAGDILDFTLAISDDGGNSAEFNYSLEIVGVANYQMLNFSLVEYDYYDEYIDGVISAGATYYAQINISNIGIGLGSNVQVFLYSSDVFVEFYYGNGTSVEYGSINSRESKDLGSYYDWDFTINPKAKAGRVINFTIVVTDSSLREWVFTSSITVEDGPNTFFYTTLGKAIIFGSPFVFILFCVVPPIRKRIRIKQGKEGDEGTLKGWFISEREKLKKKQDERQKLREQKQKEKEVQRQQRERERIARINENERQLLQKFEAIHQMSDNVHIDLVAKSLGISKSQLFERLIQWQDIMPFRLDGDIIEIEDADDFSESVQAKIAEISKYYSCYNCGFPIERTATTCPDCKALIEKCSVCKLPISFGDEIGKCSLCDTPGHLSHLQEWVKTQGKCPHCLQKIKMTSIVTVESSEKEKKK